MGSGAGVVNCFNGLLWLLILFFFSFYLAGFCAWWYVIILPCSACIDSCTPLSDKLLKGVQFPYFCAKCMVAGKSLGELGNCCK
ncbi:unnamed protein product [Notodromas monacha]|uniref:Uncharacterized protein n=1 Tax=Notodromas monacha TaxID=399045 RepID=A0A7R9C1P2_9CRUS|nr:unnamed protein product [Notodromas monacha]CAG0925788.1 unnamed protein product [Notodromas monacha]